MLNGKKNRRAKIGNADLREAVHSRNRQSNSDTWEINITLMIVNVVLVIAVIFRSEIHDFILSKMVG